MSVGLPSLFVSFFASATSTRTLCSTLVIAYYWVNLYHLSNNIGSFPAFKGNHKAASCSSCKDSGALHFHTSIACGSVVPTP